MNQNNHNFHEHQRKLQPNACLLFQNLIHLILYRIIFRKKWLKTSHYSFLVTKNFKSFQKIKKIKLNRNGLVVCFNENNEIVCIYLFYSYDNVIYDIIDLFKKSNINFDIEKEINK